MRAGGQQPGVITHYLALLVCDATGGPQGYQYYEGKGFTASVCNRLLHLVYGWLWSSCIHAWRD